MSAMASELTNAGFPWATAIVAAAGCWVTWKRRQEKWSFWIILSVLSVGWALIAASNALALQGPAGQVFPPSVIMVTSLVLITVPLGFMLVGLTRAIRSRYPGESAGRPEKPWSTNR
jgi:hypothetical protein